MISMHQTTLRFTHSMDRLSRWGAVALMLGVPTSIALVNIGVLLVIVGWLLSGQYVAKWNLIKGHPITLPCALLSLLVLLGCLYSNAPFAYWGRHLYVYSKLPLMLMLLTVLHETVWQRRALGAFALGSLITLISTYANIWIDLPWSETHNQGFGVSHNVFNDYIAQALAMSVFVIVSVFYALGTNDRIIKAFWIAIAALAVFSITHLLASRTGQVVIAFMLMSMALVSLSATRRWVALALLGGAVCLVFISSSLLRSRVDLAWQEFSSYMSGDMTLTSIGARLDMWKISLQMIADSPLWGHGTGSYRYLAEQIYTDRVVCATSCIHPHNQFLFFGVEYGLLGLGAYAFFLWRPFACGIKAAPRTRLVLVSFISVMFVDSFINGPLWVTTERHLFASMLPLLMAGWRPAETGAEQIADAATVTTSSS